jgi:hypothetical protein
VNCERRRKPIQKLAASTFFARMNYRNPSCGPMGSFLGWKTRSEAVNRGGLFDTLGLSFQAAGRLAEVTIS